MGNKILNEIQNREDKIDLLGGRSKEKEEMKDEKRKDGMMKTKKKGER